MERSDVTDIAETPPAGSEFADGWKLLVASFIGVAIGLTAMPFYTYGVFATPLQAEFGWSRGAVQLPLLFQTMGALLLLPLVGWSTDKYGARPVALLSLVTYFLAFSSFSLLTDNIYQYYATAFLLGACGAGTMPITWTKAIIGAFNRHRGIALGLALMGTGLTGFVAPAAANWFIEDHGWRSAYLMLTGASAIIGLPVVFLLFHERRNRGVEDTETLTGVSFRKAISGYRFWLIAVAFFVISFGIGGSIPNLFPLFTGEGFAPATAAGILSLIGLSVIFGRIVTGLLLDRFWAPAIAAGLMALPAISCVLLMISPGELRTAYIATVLIGFAAGAEFDIIAYLASRYFGSLNYSKIYSGLFVSFAIGAAAAPAVFGAVYDQTGSYDAIFGISAGLFLFGSLLLLFLGRYPNFNPVFENAEDTVTERTHVSG